MTSSDNQDSDVSSVPAQSGGEEDAKSNIELLLEHIPEGGLGARLAKAYEEAETESRAESLERVMKDRVEEIRSELERGPHSED